MRKVLSHIFEAVIKVLTLLPFKILDILSNISYYIIYYIIPYRKKIVFENLRIAFPQLENKEITKLAKDFYAHFCDYFFESAKSLTIRKRNFKKRMRITNPELIETFYQEGRPIIMYFAHYGNWEWFSALPYYIRYKPLTFYQSLSNKFLEEIVVRMREKAGVIATESTNAYKAMMDLERQGVLAFTYMAGDQSPKHISKKYWRPFFNKTTPFIIGTDHIARRTNHVILFPYIKKTKRHHYEVTFEILHSNPKELKEFELIDLYATRLEQQIKDDPRLWLWTHRRWKLRESEFINDKTSVFFNR